MIIGTQTQVVQLILKIPRVNKLPLTEKIIIMKKNYYKFATVFLILLLSSCSILSPNDSTTGSSKSKRIAPSSINFQKNTLIVQDLCIEVNAVCGEGHSTYQTLAREYQPQDRDRLERLEGLISECEKKLGDLNTQLPKLRLSAVLFYRNWLKKIKNEEPSKEIESSSEQMQTSKKEYASMMASLRMALESAEDTLTPLKVHIAYFKENGRPNDKQLLIKELQYVSSRFLILTEELTRGVNESNSLIKMLEVTEGKKH